MTRKTNEELVEEFEQERDKIAVCGYCAESGATDSDRSGYHAARAALIARMDEARNAALPEPNWPHIVSPCACCEDLRLQWKALASQPPKPVEVLPDAVERAMEAAVTCTETLTTRAAIDGSRDAAKANLRAAILRALNARGGGA